MVIPKSIPKSFFDRDPVELAKALLGAVLWHRPEGELWLAARIIETEAYYQKEKGSHASLGYTEKRKALFMPPGTIYMYYARGGDSFNISCGDAGDAVLIKSGFPYTGAPGFEEMIRVMQNRNPLNGRARLLEKLCAGQTLLCKSMGIRVKDWDGKPFDPEKLFISMGTDFPSRIIRTVRMGIPKGRDEYLHLRFIDRDYAKFCTSNPLTKRNWIENQHFTLLSKN